MKKRGYLENAALLTVTGLALRAASTRKTENLLMPSRKRADFALRSSGSLKPAMAQALVTG